MIVVQGPQGPIGPQGPQGLAPATVLMFSGSDTLAGEDIGRQVNYTIGFASSSGLARSAPGTGLFILPSTGDIAFRAPRDGFLSNLWFELYSTLPSSSFPFDLQLLIDVQIYVGPNPGNSVGSFVTRATPTPTALTAEFTGGVGTTYPLNGAVANNNTTTIVPVNAGDIVALLFRIVVSNTNITSFPFNIHAGLLFS